MNIADRIQHLRKTKGISQEELADKLGVSRQAVSKWESEQSIPDVEKIIILSDYFEVTTDYILKGIESEKQAVQETDANIFTVIATALNFIGLLISCFVIYEKHDPMAVVISLIIFTVGCVIFYMGQIKSTLNKAIAKRTFWVINIWILVFIPLSSIYNGLLSLPMAPFPQRSGNPFAFPIFCLIYIAICLSVVYMQIKKLHKR